MSIIPPEECPICSDKLLSVAYGIKRDKIEPIVHGIAFPIEYPKYTIYVGCENCHLYKEGWDDKQLKYVFRLGISYTTANDSEVGIDPVGRDGIIIETKGLLEDDMTKIFMKAISENFDDYANYAAMLDFFEENGHRYTKRFPSTYLVLRSMNEKYLGLR